LRILLTGATGFIGRRFLAEEERRFEIRPFSLTTGPPSTAELAGIDAVVHLGALVHRLRDPPSWEEFRRANCERTLELARQAKEAGVRQLVFMSSSKVFGESSHGTPYDEASPTAPEDDYGRSKLAAEEGLAELRGEGFRVAALRPPLVYGEGVKANFLRLLQLVEKVPVLPFRGAENRRSMIYVGNLVAVIAAVLRKGGDGTFVVADQPTLTLEELVREIAGAMAKRRGWASLPRWAHGLLRRRFPEAERRLFGSFELDPSSSLARLGLDLPYTTEDGVRRTVNWYRHRSRGERRREP
jgi:UDP-glucose 4-epimerase